MVQPSQFAQVEQDFGGKLHFILCPHLAKQGYPDFETRFITLIDEPDNFVKLTLCGVCSNIVIGTMADRIVKTIADNALLNVKDAMEQALRESKGA